jgi:hypothetical protein
VFCCHPTETCGEWVMNPPLRRALDAVLSRDALKREGYESFIKVA